MKRSEMAYHLHYVDGLTWREVGERMGCSSRVAWNHAWRHRNPEKSRAAVRKWAKRNPEKVKERRRRYRARAAERARERRREDPEHAARANQWSKGWKTRNPDRVRAASRKRDARRDYHSDERQAHRRAYWARPENQARQRLRNSLRRYGPEWGPVHRALHDLQAKLNQREDDNAE